MNRLFLNPDAIDGELDMEDGEIFWIPEYHSHFAELFESEESMAAFLPFIDIEDADQDVLLDIVCGTEDSDEEDKPLTEEEERKFIAEANFLSIDRETRHLLKQAFNFGLIQSIEAELLTNFMNVDASFMRSESYEYFTLASASPQKGRRARSKSQEQNGVGIFFKNSKDRKVCHGVCKYYSLYSMSEDHKQGDRLTTINRPHEYIYSTSPPPLLSEYLWDNYFRA